MSDTKRPFQYRFHKGKWQVWGVSWRSFMVAGGVAEWHNMPVTSQGTFERETLLRPAKGCGSDYSNLLRAGDRP